jgi:shikimate 5-dehydrogenase
MIVYTLQTDEEEVEGADIIELRPDRTTRTEHKNPYLLTNQPPHQNAPYVDVAYPNKLGSHHQNFPNTKWIYSYHGTFVSKEHVAELLEIMSKERPYLIKCCFDSIRMGDYLDLIPLFSIYPQKLILFARGERCQATRLLSYIFGARWIYTSKEGFHGQIPFDELKDIYQISRLHRDTALFGLLKGEESPKSIGYKLYNPLFAKKAIDALYLNLVIETSELKKLLDSPYFQGFSITMPFKEASVEFCKELDASAKLCQTVNTYYKGKGFNTDIEILNDCDFKGKRVAILGGGGVAKAFANFLKKESLVHVFLRDPHKKKAFEESCGVPVFLLEELLPDFDLVIDTLPVTGLRLPFKEGAAVLDMKVFHDPYYEKSTYFISGREAFLRQGERQLKIFFNTEVFL